MPARKLGQLSKLDKAATAKARAKRMDYPLHVAMAYAKRTWERDALEYLMKQPNERSVI